MNQTLIALAALLSAMVFSFAQQRTIVDSTVRQANDLYEARKAKEGQNLLDRLEDVPFDPSVLSGTVESTDSLSLGTELDETAGLDDVQTLNDVSVLQYEPVESADSLELYVSATVRYVEPTGGGGFEPSQDPTFFKEVSVTVTSGSAHSGEEVHLSRVYTYTPEQ